MNHEQHSVVIRSLQKKDIDGVYTFLNNLSKTAKQNFHPHPFDKTAIVEIINSKKDHYYVMLVDDNIIGYSFLRLFGYQIPSFGCCIDEQHQHIGYGITLTNWTLKKAKEQGYSKVILKVYKKNKKAYMMYKKIGFAGIQQKKESNEIYMDIHL